MKPIKPTISLITDFGLTDAYVGIVKGVIFSVNPHASIVDISHRIDPQDLIRAAHMLHSSYRWFPEGTIHMVVVDPGVGSDRSIVAAESDNHLFLAPDNGVLTGLLAEETIKTAVKVENRRYFLSPVSRTFHGRDIFAPAAAHLSLGLELSQLGPVVDPEDLVQIRLPTPRVSREGEIVGTIIDADRFGNLITNIDVNHIGALLKNDASHKLQIEIGTSTIKGVSESYADVASGALLGIVGSRGVLEVSVNCGNARETLGIAPGDRVRIVCIRKSK